MPASSQRAQLEPLTSRLGCWGLGPPDHSEEKMPSDPNAVTKNKQFIVFPHFSLPVCPASDWEHISLLCFCMARTHTHTHTAARISLSIHGEHPRLQWVTPGYANSLPRAPPRSAPWFPHRRHLEPIGGRVTPSHKALKGSQTHHG